MNNFSVIAIAIALAITVAQFREPPHIENNREAQLHGIINKYKKALNKRDTLLTELFGRAPTGEWLTTEVTITWYSLSVDETDATPDDAAHGKSRPFMAAISTKVVDTLFLVPGDRVAVISSDGEVAAIVTYWDEKNIRYAKGNWVDIVAPSKAVAERWSIRPGRLVKL